MRQELSKDWISVALRLQNLANTSEGRNVKIELVVLVDNTGKPRHVMAQKKTIEPKKRSLDWFLSLLHEGEWDGGFSKNVG